MVDAGLGFAQGRVKGKQGWPEQGMGWVLKNLLRLLVVAVLVFVGWAFFADLPPPKRTITVELSPEPGAGVTQ